MTNDANTLAQRITEILGHQAYTIAGLMAQVDALGIEVERLRAENKNLKEVRNEGQIDTRGGAVGDIRLQSGVGTELPAGL